MFKNPLFLLMSGVVGAATFAFAVPAHAQLYPATETVSTTVKYADLDLSTVQGARTVLHRIRGAADKICDTGWNYDECVNGAVGDAVVRLNSPMVTALSGRAPAANH